MPKPRSLSTQLILALSAVVVIASLMHALGSYALARSSTNAILDTRLRDVAIRMSAGMANLILPSSEPAFQRPQDLEIQVWSGDEPYPSQVTNSEIHFPRAIPLGFSDQFVAGERWRIFVVQTPHHRVEVGQRERIRETVARENALSTLWPTVLLMPMLWGAVILVVRRTMKQVGTLAEEVQAINLSRLAPIDDKGVALDLLPFVESTNKLIDRLALMIESEKKFISDAAHELRSPITALQIQADNLRHTIYPENQERFEELRQGIMRGGNLVKQLLSLARADARVQETTFVDIDVKQIVAQVIADSLPVAMQRNIDLGVARMDDDVKVRALSTDVTVVVKNLVENAIRYSPDHSVIDVRVVRRRESVCIEVVDEGPGIAPDMLECVFERFVRAEPSKTEGTGLGLAIVRATMTRYQGRAILENRTDGSTGLIARVTFPRERRNLTSGFSGPLK
ncbi:histidine kinase [Pararobbsia alpina]|uniref:ATP-binding protein n=1 Tax=Pararobbsia alpina TaxID=621374 RepID=UPI0039A6D985